MRPLSLITLAVLLTAAAACTSKNRVTCDETTPCNPADVKTFCDIDGVYPASELENECIVPPSADACNRIETCPAGDKSMCTDESMGVCVECLEGLTCATGEICNNDGACEAFSCSPGTAGNADCTGVDASQPFCGDGGFCVGCLESADCTVAGDEICDGVDFQCRGCEANPECDSQLCGIATGICADEADILYVVEGATGTMCTLLAPCGDIMTAVDLVPTTGKETILVGTGNYPERIVSSTIVASIIAEGVVTLSPTLILSTERAVDLSGTANLTISGVDIAPNGTSNVNSDAVFCIDGTASLVLLDSTVTGARDSGVIAESCDLTITGSTISGNSGLGVTSSSGSLTITGSTISGNDGGGIDVSNSDYTIVNNFIAKNSSTAVGGLAISGDGANLTKEVSFNTFAENTRTDPGYAIGCIGSDLVASNNVFLHVDNGTTTAFVSGSGCTTTYSLFDTDVTMPAGMGNVSDDAVFVNANIGDYHLVSGSPGIDAADPAATLMTDIDGEVRPQGGRHDMGADEAE